MTAAPTVEPTTAAPTAEMTAAPTFEPTTAAPTAETTMLKLGATCYFNVETMGHFILQC